jgi:hypothetical protein
MRAALLDALREEIRALLREELTRTGVAAAEFSSSSPPPNITPRTFARWCRSGRVAGAQRDGSGWRCSAGAWREARGGGTRRPAPTLTLVVPNDDVAVMLHAAGLRPTRTR